MRYQVWEYGGKNGLMVNADSPFDAATAYIKTRDDVEPHAYARYCHGTVGGLNTATYIADDGSGLVIRVALAIESV